MHIFYYGRRKIGFNSMVINEYFELMHSFISYYAFIYHIYQFYLLMVLLINI